MKFTAMAFIRVIEDKKNMLVEFPCRPVNLIKSNNRSVYTIA